MNLRLLAVLLLMATATSGCASVTQNRSTLVLAMFTENDVEVSIRLENNEAGDYILSATFTPPDGFHLYSKDIPRTGVDGLGRPTLLELTTNSQLKAQGELQQSVAAERPNFEPQDLFVYPAGPVTLSLPVELPAGTDWVDDEVSVTFMACSASLCKPPVTGKVVSIHIPSADGNR